MTQFSLKKILHIFGEEEENTTKKQLEHLHLLQAFTQLDATHLTQKKGSYAISSLMFFIQKRKGSIKARACAEGKNRENICQKMEQPHNHDA